MSKKQQIGIDLGSTAVRAVAVSGTDANGMPNITAISTVPVPPGAISGGRIVHPDIVADAIKQTLRQAKMSGYGVVVGLSTPRVAISTFQLPAALKPKEWESVLRLEGTEVSPLIKLHEAYLGFSRIPSGPNVEDPTMSLLSVSAVRQEDVDALMVVCRMARITPRAVDLAAAATFRGLTAFPAGDHSGSSTIVDVGATTCTVATRAGQRVRSVKLIEEGSSTISLALKGALGIRYEEAEELKKSVKVGTDNVLAAKSSAALALASVYGSIEDPNARPEEDDRATVAVRAATVAADGLVEKIAAAVEDDAAYHPRQLSASISLCGRGALMHGLAARVESRLGIPTFVRRPYINVIESSRTRDVFIDGTVDPARLLDLVTATGLAMWKEEI